MAPGRPGRAARVGWSGSVRLGSHAPDPQGTGEVEETTQLWEDAEPDLWKPAGETRFPKARPGSLKRV